MSEQEVPNPTELVNRSILWEVGDDFDCETCGFSWNRAEFAPNSEGTNKWRFSYNLGCYNGNSISYENEDIEAGLTLMFEVLQNYPNWGYACEQNIREEIGKIVEGQEK